MRPQIPSLFYRRSDDQPSSSESTNTDSTTDSPDSAPVMASGPAAAAGASSPEMAESHAHSLDVIASPRSRSRAAVGAGQDAVPDDVQQRVQQPQDDSRSSSSTSSPAPAEYEESDFFLGNNDSESSLGVPNLQDMQVTDDGCLATINKLPNEILISIFQKLSAPSDLLHCMLTCKRWARNSVDGLWHRPACTTWVKHSSICHTLSLQRPYFAYRDFIKRLNLAALADKVNDGSIMPLAVCSRVERLTLTNCKGLTDVGLCPLLIDSDHLLALDISGDEQITETSIYTIAENCKRLQGLNISNCTKISNESLIKLAENCRFIKRLKLNDCGQLTDDAVLAFAEHCPNILEIDLHQCKLIGNHPVTNLLAKGQCLRELRLACCELIDDAAFLALPSSRTYEHLRILDLTSCLRLTDRAVEKIVEVAPRLRNLVLAKCRNITDAAVFAISRLGKNLHYVHLGHCGQITDDAVKRLVQCCNRIRYIDLGCCIHLTDDSVTRLAMLPKLKRIGLVKCSNITDESVYALARANQRQKSRIDANGIVVKENYFHHSSLERVHLSYCTNLTLRSIIKLLNSCPRLTHLSLTGVQAFLREDLESFCRDAPPEFTEHQRNVFCVFSGQGVLGLRRYLNTATFAEMHERGDQVFGRGNRQAHPNEAAGIGEGAGIQNVDGNFDEQEPDVVDDEDGMDDGSEMAIDTQPLLAGAQPAPAGGIMDAIPPPPPPPLHNHLHGPGPDGFLVPQVASGPVVHFSTNPQQFVQYIPPHPHSLDFEDTVDGVDMMGMAGSGSPELGFADTTGRDDATPSASNAGPSTMASGPSTATGDAAFGHEGEDGGGASIAANPMGRPW